jgi:hypothetical protein
VENNATVVYNLEAQLDRIKKLVESGKFDENITSELREIGFGGLLLLYMVQDIKPEMIKENDIELEETHREIHEFTDLLNGYIEENSLEKTEGQSVSL